MTPEGAVRGQDENPKMSADDPMMRRAEMMVTGGDVRDLGTPEDVEAEDREAERRSSAEVVPGDDFEPDASQ